MPGVRLIHVMAIYRQRSRKPVPEGDRNLSPAFQRWVGIPPLSESRQDTYAWYAVPGGLGIQMQILPSSELLGLDMLSASRTDLTCKARCAQ
jgi:hypothetical protein